MGDKQPLNEDLGTFAMPLLESDSSHSHERSKLIKDMQFQTDSVMASPPRESREINDYCLQWSHEANLNSGIAPDICRSISQPTTFTGNNDETAMSFTDEDVHLTGNMELENIVNQNDCARKRRRSLTAVDNAERDHNDISPLIIKDLSLSPSERSRRPRSVGQTTEDELTSVFDRDIALEDAKLGMGDEIKVDSVEYLDELTDDKNTWSYTNLLKAHACYDIIPHSSKIVVFDTRLRVKKAFFALVYNGIRAAPVWEASKHEFVGMLTITDFINILRCYYKSPLERMSELEEHKIETWRELSQSDLKPKLLRIAPTESLFEAVRMLVTNQIHRLPVIDPETGNALFILTHKKILKYIYNHFDDMAMPDFMGYTLEKIGIGTLWQIATVRPETSVIEALNIFAEKKVSALPVVDNNGKVCNVYARFDVINLAAEKTYNNLDISVDEALKHRQEGFEGVHKCMLSESFYAIIDRIVNAKVHRLVVVDKDDVVLGIISLSDILKFLVLAPCSKENSQIFDPEVGEMES